MATHLHFTVIFSSNCVKSLLADLKNTFEKVEAARVNASVNAFKSIEEASMRVSNLIQKVIKDAMEDDHSGKNLILSSDDCETMHVTR